MQALECVALVLVSIALLIHLFEKGLGYWREHRRLHRLVNCHPEMKGVHPDEDSLFVFESDDWIDRITPYSGSGPAYIFEVARIMCKELEDLGLDVVSAEKMVAHTIYGSAKMLVESNDSPKALRDNVTSKKGVTYEALQVFKDSDFPGIFKKALKAAYARAKELSI